MANYNLMINSKFQPFSFERYMQPISMYAQQYENRYKEMQQQALVAGLMGSMVDPELDKETYEALQKYNNNLQRMSDIMSTVGLPPNQRKNFLDLWKQYATDVMPIENWAKMRNADIEKQSNLYAQTNGNVVFSRNARDTSLDYYRKGRPLDYEMSNLNAALSESSTAFATLAKQYRNTEEGYAFNNAFIKFTQRTGIKDPQVFAKIAARSGEYPELEKMMSMLEDKYGSNNPNFSDADRNRIRETLLEGAALGIASAYDEKVAIQEDPVARDARNYQYQIATMQYSYDNDPSKKKDALEAAALAGQLGDAGLEDERSISYLDATGDLASANALADVLLNVDSSLTMPGYSAGTYYAGSDRKEDKNGKDRRDKPWINPLVVYNEYYTLTHPKFKSLADKGATEGPEPQRYYTELRKQARETLRKKYGVTEILTDEQANILKKLGYTTKSTEADYKDLRNKINKQASQYAHYSINTSEQALGALNPRATSALNNLGVNGNLANNVWDIDRNGKAKPIKKFKDIGLPDLDSKDKTINYSLQDIYYSAQEPDKIHIQYGGKDFYIKPSLISNEMAYYVNMGRDILSIKDDNLMKETARKVLNSFEKTDFDVNAVTRQQVSTEVTRFVTRMLRKLSNAHNLGRGYTSNQV